MNTLPILDDLERALMSVDAHLAGLTWLDGVRLIYRKLQLILENAGVSAIEVEGQQFDPRYHEAVMHADGPEGKVWRRSSAATSSTTASSAPPWWSWGRGMDGGRGTAEGGQHEAEAGRRKRKASRGRNRAPDVSLV